MDGNLREFAINEELLGAESWSTGMMRPSGMSPLVPAGEGLLLAVKLLALALVHILDEVHRSSKTQDTGLQLPIHDEQ